MVMKIKNFIMKDGKPTIIFEDGRELTFHKYDLTPEERVMIEVIDTYFYPTIKELKRRLTELAEAVTSPETEIENETE